MEVELEQEIGTINWKWNGTRDRNNKLEMEWNNKLEMEWNNKLEMEWNNTLEGTLE